MKILKLDNFSFGDPSNAAYLDGYTWEVICVTASRLLKEYPSVMWWEIRHFLLPKER